MSSNITHYKSVNLNCNPNFSVAGKLLQAILRFLVSESPISFAGRDNSRLLLFRNRLSVSAVAFASKAELHFHPPVRRMCRRVSPALAASKAVKWDGFRLVLDNFCP